MYLDSHNSKKEELGMHLDYNNSKEEEYLGKHLDSNNSKQEYLGKEFGRNNPINLQHYILLEMVLGYRNNTVYYWLFI